MLAFLIFTIILLATIGLIHSLWNSKRDKQDALDAQSEFAPLFCHANREGSIADTILLSN